MTANTARAKKVAFKYFVKGYKAGCSDGKSAQEIADTCFPTPMNEPSMTSRASGIRQMAANIGKSFPSPAGGGGTKEEKKREKIDLLTSLLDDLDVDETDGESEDESVE